MSPLDRRSDLEIVCHERDREGFLDSIQWRWGMPRCFTGESKAQEFYRLHDFLHGACLVTESSLLSDELATLVAVVVEMNHSYQAQEKQLHEE